VLRENVSWATWKARFGAGGKPVAVVRRPDSIRGARFIDVLFDIADGES